MNIPNLEELNLTPEDIQKFSANYLRDSFENDIKHLKHHLRSKGRAVDPRRSYFFRKYKGDVVHVIGAHIELRTKSASYTMNQSTLDEITETVRCINENIAVYFNVVKYYEDRGPKFDSEEEGDVSGEIKILSMTLLRVIE